MKESANLWKLYAFRFASSLIPAYVIERLYWESRGMNIQMVVYAEIIFAITVVLLEVPTGILADRWGRKRMLVLSALLSGFEFFLLLFAQSFWHFACVMVLAGVSRTASSGSANALLYDLLALDGKTNTFEKYVGRLNAIDFVSAMLAALCGSALADRHGLELNYWISVGSSIVALLMAAWLKVPAATNGENLEPAIPFHTYARESIRFFQTNEDVRLMVLSGMVIGASLGFLYEFWQIYLNRLGTPVIYFGSVSAAIMMLQLPGSLTAHALLHRLRHRTLVLIVIAVFTFGFAMAALTKDYFGLAFLLVICLFAGLMDPIVSGYLHHRMDSRMRATLDSFQSLGLNVVSILAGMGFSYGAGRYDVFGGFGFLAVLCGFFLIWFHMVSRTLKQGAPYS